MATTIKTNETALVRALHAGVLGAAMLLLAACSGTAAAAAGPRASLPTATGECSILTAADIQAITGAEVHAVARGAFPGAGGTCGNYQGADGYGFLGINALTSSAEYSRSVGAIPDGIYPVRESLTGLGDESLLVKDRSERPTVRYLVVRQGDAGVVLFPMSDEISDDQLKQLASKALGAM